MDIRGFLELLRNTSLLPLDVRIGGFRASDRPFLSRGDAPYRRSFSIQGDKVVVVGWPYEPAPAGFSDAFPQTLFEIRRRAQGLGILHAYHRAESDRDNDLFFRIGLIDPGAVRDDVGRRLERQMRRQLSLDPPLVLGLGVDDLCVAAYEDQRLPLDTTEVWPLSDPGLEKILSASYFRRTHLS
jgi:hypothetical protein